MKMRKKIKITMSSVLVAAFDDKILNKEESERMEQYAKNYVSSLGDKSIKIESIDIVG